MNNHKKERLQSLFQKLISVFLQRANIKDCLITVTHIEFSENLKNVKVFVSIYPEKEENNILKILEKQKSGLKKHLASKTRMKFLPNVNLEIDKGEKNRLRIEELLNK
ncbi:MAG: ribosome-binding factor A [Candidatus Tagabacteria bacterium CG09_land_8_20_14_0_10_41_14]|uniref:Ribosome-binding factor A n=1 Tax=Candidatus Tagabacteria bacterium CG09_land_8_20_14_0_10_41_14 TaxID=1975021 RepID=A0A2H0WNY0_9BACT|nr:MAG: ribosome-binding factor A [Candidatus Tagabacteria bacterium CG09_land_8_20_14_0_10_41_14]